MPKPDKSGSSISITILVGALMFILHDPIHDPISAAHFLASEDTRNISAGPVLNVVYIQDFSTDGCAGVGVVVDAFDFDWFFWKLPNLQRSKQTNTCYHMLNFCLLKSFTLVSFNSWAPLDSYHEQWTCSKKQKGNYNRNSFGNSLPRRDFEIQVCSKLAVPGTAARNYTHILHRIWYDSVAFDLLIHATFLRCYFVHSWIFVTSDIQERIWQGKMICRMGA